MPLIDVFGFLNQYAQLSEKLKKNCDIIMLTSSENTEDALKAKRNPYVKKFLNKPLTAYKEEEIFQ